MTRVLLVAAAAAALCAGCRLYLWAGSHELTIPPPPEATPTPLPTPDLAPIPGDVY